LGIPCLRGFVQSAERRLPALIARGREIMGAIKEDQWLPVFAHIAEDREQFPTAVLITAERVAAFAVAGQFFL
jgi:hypothetical protein